MLGRMRRGAAVFALALLALALAGGTSASSQGRQRVTLIGDSVATSISYTATARTLLGRGIDLHFAAVVCRRLVQQSCWYNGSRPTTALEMVQTAGRSLGDTVIVESGYNEYVDQYPDDLDEVMRALVDAGVDNVLWMTLHEQRLSYHTMNAAIRAAAAKWPQLVVVDWEAYSKNRSWFGDDGIHLNYAGTMGMARMLRSFVVEYACGGSCVKRPIS
jgi:hypothetical protein